MHNKCTYKLVRIYTEPNWSGLGLNRYGTNEYSQTIVILKGALFTLKFLLNCFQKSIFFN